jgi:hypothetical protein
MVSSLQRAGADFQRRNPWRPVPSSRRIVGGGSPGLALLRNEAVFWVDAALSSVSGGKLTNLGTGGSALDAQFGSTTGADSNDPTVLSHTGVNYLYLPGVTGNYATIPDPAVFAGATQLDVRAWVAADDWTPASVNVLLAQSAVASECFRLYIAHTGPAGRLMLQTSTDGTATVVAPSSAVPTITDASALGVRATWRSSDGRVQFFTKPVTTQAELSSHTGWTQLGTDQLGVTGPLFNSTSLLGIGGNSATGSEPYSGKTFGVWAATTIDGSAAVDIDFTRLSTGAETSFTATTGQTVTINRSTSGRKAAVVVRPTILLGTDDYFEVPDNALLNFGASDSFTVVALYRTWSTTINNAALVAKVDDTTPNPGWRLYQGVTGANVGTKFLISDTVAFPNINGGFTTPPGTMYLAAGVRNVTADTITTYMNGTTGSLTDTTTGSLLNTYAMRIGRNANAATSYNDMEFFAAFVVPKALTAAEIAALRTYYGTA